MHENLDTTYSLDLNNQWQTLVADYEYGTFYTIHCKFDFKKDTKSPEKCSLYIQNFEGNVTLGLVSINPTIEIVDDPLKGKPSYVMFIHLKALHVNNSLNNQNISIGEVPKNHPEMKGFHKDYSLKVELIFDKVDGFNENDLSKSKFIDSTRFIRDGDGLIKNTKGQRHNYNTTNVYEDYTRKQYGLGLKKFSIYESHVAHFGHTKESDVFDMVILSNGEAKKMLKPYPCYLSYIKFI